MKGLAGITLVAGLVITVILLSIGISMFTGGSQSSGLFGWGDESLLAGVEDFVTGIYNTIIVLASWATIFVLFMVFLGTQVVFIYFYYRVALVVMEFKPMVEKFIKEVTGF